MNTAATPSTTRQKSPVGVVGLGLLGTALAERLLGAGFEVRVFNRSRDKAEPLLARGAVWSDNPLADCERTVVCLFSSSVVGEVLQQFDAGLRPGSTIIDATTGDPEQSTALGRRLAERGVRYLESPIVASSEQTRQGKALALVAGNEQAFGDCRDLFDSLTARALFVGPWGSASKVKLVNNLVLGLNRAALAEGLVLAKSLGLDPAKTLEVLKQGNAYSTVMDVKGAKMLAAEYSPEARLAQHAKDVRLMLETGGRGGATLPMSRLHLRLLEAAEAAGWGDLDNCAILKAIEELRVE